MLIVVTIVGVIVSIAGFVLLAIAERPCDKAGRGSH